MSIGSWMMAKARKLTMAVVINSSPVLPSNPTSAGGTPGVGRLSIVRSFDDPIPRAEITVNRVATKFDRGQSVAIDLGYNGFTARRFTGHTQVRARAVARGTITAAGSLWRAYKTIDVPSFDASGMTIKEAIENRLDLAGITNYEVDASLDFVLGTVVPAVLEEGPISDQLEVLMDIRDAMAFELGNGQVIVRPIDFQPAPTASGQAYDTENQATARILDGSDREDPESFRDQVTATGATIPVTDAGDPSYPAGDPDDPDTVWVALGTVNGDGGLTATLIGSPLQQPPNPAGAFSTAILSNPLIDVLAELQTYVTRKLSRFARIPRYVSLELHGDPTLELAQTRAFNFPLIDVEGRWFVYGLEDSVDNAPDSETGEVPGYKNFVTLRGGEDNGGTIAVNPIAAFTYAVVLQAFDDDIYAIISLDGSASISLDGEITDWDWIIDGNPYSGQQVTVAVLASSGDTVSVDLTVTADNSLTDSHHEDVTIDTTGFFVTQPAVGSAAGIRKMITPDGGTTWIDNTSASDSMAIDAKPDAPGMWAVINADGAIVRTTDFGAAWATVLAAGGSAGRDMWWDKNVPTRAWAGGVGGELWRSDTDAASWVLHINEGQGPVNKIATPIPNGGVWKFGGRADIPTSLIRFDAGVTGVFTSVAIGGELAADLVGASSAISVQAAWARVGGTLGIIFKGGVLPGGVNIFYTNDVHGDGSAWKRATGLDGGLGEGRVAMPDFGPNVAYAMFNDRNAWHIDTTTGVPACTKVTDFLPAGYTPNHGLFEGDFLGGLVGVHLLAVENAAGDGGIMKSIDGMQTANWFRPIGGLSTWPAGAKSKMVAIGAPGLASSAFEIFVQMAGGSQELMQNTGAAWVANSTDAADPNWNLKNLNGVLYRIADRLNSSDIGGPGDLERSIDDGANWTIEIAKSSPNGVQAVTIAADGTLYAIFGSHTSPGGANPLKVYRSTDNGENWTLIYTDADASGLIPVDIATHPTDSNILAISCIRNSGGARILYCGNAAAGTPTFTQRTITATGSGTSGLWISFSASGRIVVAGGGTLIQTSDDLGVTWTTRDNPAGTVSSFIVRFGSRLLYGVGPASSNGGSVRISEDEGTTWSEYVNGTDVGVTTPLSDYPQGIALDQDGGLNIMWGGTVLTAEWWRNADPWGSGTWDSIAFNGDSVSTGSASLQGLAAGPDRQ